MGSNPPLFLSSSVVERSAVNWLVVGSNPTWGDPFYRKPILFRIGLALTVRSRSNVTCPCAWYMYAKSPQDKDRVPVVRERKDERSLRIEILNWKVRRNKFIVLLMWWNFQSWRWRGLYSLDLLLVARPVLLELSVQNLEVKIGSLHAVNIFLWENLGFYSPN